MFCNYENIVDYCCNKYSYKYAKPYNTNFIIRIDNDTGETVLLDSSSSQIINNCDVSDNEEFITAWNCYRIYIDLCDGVVSDSDTESYSLYQNDKISSLYYDQLSNGYLVKIDDFIVSSIVSGGSGSGSGSGSESSSDEIKVFSIRLKAREEDKIYYGNIFALANLIYIKDNDAELPYVVDFFNKAHKFNYQNIVKIFNKYFYGLKKLQNLRDDNVNRLNDADTLDKILDTDLYQSKPSENINNISSFIDQVPSLDQLSCNDKQGINQTIFCDENSDCDSEQSCVEGVCL